MSRRAWRVLLVGWVLGSLMIVPPASAAADDSERLSIELDLRRELGFSTDVATVEALMRDPSSYGGKYPIAMTRAEQVEFDRRVLMEIEMTALEERSEALPGFAGHWIDQAAGGVIVVNIVGDAEQHRDALAPLVPKGATLRLQSVSYPSEELQTIDDRIKDDWDRLAGEGFQIAHLGVDVSDNRVIVGLANFEAGRVQALVQRYGEAVSVEPANPGTTACVTRENCFGPPLRGGISAAPPGTSLTNRCSLGFMVHQGANVQWLTAGHCAPTVGASWTHAGNSAWGIGTIKATCWPGCNFSDAARGGNINASYASSLVYLNGDGDLQAWSVGAQQGFDADDEGDLVCLNARKAEAWRCGTIHHKGRMTYSGGIYFDEQRFATYASKYGDSGGAVHSNFIGNTVTAYGIASGCTNLQNNVCVGYGVYSHIFRIGQELGVSVCRVSNPCP